MFETLTIQRVPFPDIIFHSAGTPVDGSRFYTHGNVARDKRKAKRQLNQRRGKK